MSGSLKGSRPEKKHTDLRPRQLGEAADELGRRVDAELESLFVDYLADAVPERGLEALDRRRG